MELYLTFTGLYGVDRANSSDTFDLYPLTPQVDLLYRVAHETAATRTAGVPGDEHSIMTTKYLIQMFFYC